ncbi:hypothetical protein [Streptomyces sp. NPDC099088]|uniref:hypothetical protein n=1 Tax=Streptomyces sp. NPDC099088 TaxID=3366101 RepID=UPI0037F5C594
MPWIGLMGPDPEGLASAAARFDLHLLEVEHAHKGYQPAKLERYGDTMFVVPRPASHDDRRESVHFGEVHLSVGPQIVITSGMTPCRTCPLAVTPSKRSRSVSAALILIPRCSSRHPRLSDTGHASPVDS